MLCDRERLAKLYFDVLTERLGVPAQPTAEGDIVFDVAGSCYVVRNFAPDDPEFLVIYMAFALDEDADHKPATLLAVANAVNTQATGAHVVVNDGCVIITAEMIVAGPDCLPIAEHLTGLLPRCISTLAYTAQRFFVDLELAGIASASAA